jgi:hypothetical protein
MWWYVPRIAVLRLEMTVLTRRNASISLDWRGLTTIASWAATCAPAQPRLAKASVTRCASGSGALRTHAQRVALEIRERVEAHVSGMAVLVQLHRGDERGFAFRAASALAAAMLAPDHGIVGDNHAGEDTAGLALGQRFEELVLEPPGGAIAHAEMPFERQCGEVVLVLSDQVHGLKPLGQRQLGAFEPRPARQRGLHPAPCALPVRPPVGVEPAGCRGSAVRTDESPRQPRRLQGRGALRFDAVACEEVVQGHARLELNRVLRHRRGLAAGGDARRCAPGGGSIRESAGSKNRRLRHDANHLPHIPLVGRPTAIIGVDLGKMRMAFRPMLFGPKRSATLPGTSSTGGRHSLTRRLMQPAVS